MYGLKMARTIHSRRPRKRQKVAASACTAPSEASAVASASSMVMASSCDESNEGEQARLLVKLMETMISPGEYKVDYFARSCTDTETVRFTDRTFCEFWSQASHYLYEYQSVRVREPDYFAWWTTSPPPLPPSPLSLLLFLNVCGSDGSKGPDHNRWY